MFDYNNKNIANAPAKFESNEVDASTCVKLRLNVGSANIRWTNNDTRNCRELQMLYHLHCFLFDYYWTCLMRIVSAYVRNESAACQSSIRQNTYMRLATNVLSHELRSRHFLRVSDGKKYIHPHKIAFNSVGVSEKLSFWEKFTLTSFQWQPNDIVNCCSCLKLKYLFFCPFRKIFRKWTYSKSR